MLFGVFLIAHGVGHVSWFLASFFPNLEERGAPLYSADVSRTGVVAKALGLLALAVAAGFVVASVGVFTHSPWWRAALLAAVFGSAAVALLWWNPVGAVSIPALVADLALLIVALLPVGRRIVEAL